MLFQHIAWSQRAIRLVPDSTIEWALDTKVSQSWHNLETQFLHIIRQFMMPNAYLVIPLSVAIGQFPTPSDYNYQRSYSSFGEAKRAITKARDAFIPLVAVISFLMALYGPTQSSTMPGWYMHLENCGYHPAWLQLFFESPQFSLNQRRVGTFLDGSLGYFTIPHMEMLIERGVPLYFCHRLHITRNIPDETDIFAAYQPTYQDIKNADRAWQHQNSMEVREQDGSGGSNQVDDPHMIPSMPNIIPWGEGDVVEYEVERSWGASVGTTTDWANIQVPDAEYTSPPPPPEIVDEFPGFPDVHPHSSQRRGETWQQFFERRRERNQRREGNETPASRQSRLSREDAQRNHPQPGRRGPRVFIWEEIDGHRIRTPAWCRPLGWRICGPSAFFRWRSICLCF